MKRLVPLFASLLLTACISSVQTGQVARYDLGSFAGTGLESRVPIGEVEVQAASWLSGPAMHYRLAYSDPLRRRSYAESQWAAPPAELLEALLKRRIVFGQGGFGGAGCRLQLAIDEMEQRFDDPQQSHVVLEVRAQLTPRGVAGILAGRVFLIRKPAAQPVARGGVAATREAAQGLADDLAGWMAGLARETPAVVERCRA